MAENGGKTPAEICRRLGERRLPRWEELPDLDLYMDQVLALIKKYLSPYPGFDETGLTASMVNNYVKAGILPPPVKKRYSRRHLSGLLMICLIKSSLSIADIRRLMGILPDVEESVLYNRFCELAELSAREAFDALQKDQKENSVPVIILRGALRAHAEQAVAQSFCSELPEGSDEGKSL